MSALENNQNAQSVNTSASLSDLEFRILEFERSWWRFAGAKESGAKESAIKELFDLSAPRYYQILNDLIDRQDALEASPMLVKRLRRLRDARTSARTTR
jgi:hypothetical protein